jgi:hypothetical protein
MTIEFDSSFGFDSHQSTTFFQDDCRHYPGSLKRKHIFSNNSQYLLNNNDIDDDNDTIEFQKQRLKMTKYNVGERSIQFQSDFEPASDDDDDDEQSHLIGGIDQHSWIHVLKQVFVMQNPLAAAQIVAAFGSTCRTARDMFQTDYCIDELASHRGDRLPLTMKLDFDEPAVRAQPMRYCRALPLHAHRVGELHIRFANSEREPTLYNAIVRECLRLCPRVVYLRLPQLPELALLDRLRRWRRALFDLHLTETRSISAIVYPAPPLERWRDAGNQLNVGVCPACRLAHTARCGQCNMFARCDRCFDATSWVDVYSGHHFSWLYGKHRLAARKRCDAAQCEYQPLCDRHAFADNCVSCECNECDECGQCDRNRVFHRRCARATSLVNCLRCSAVVCRRSAFVGDCKATFAATHRTAAPPYAMPSDGSCFVCESCVRSDDTRVVERCAGGCRTLRCRGSWHGGRVDEEPPTVNDDYRQRSYYCIDDTETDLATGCRTLTRVDGQTPFWVQCGRGARCLASVDVMPLRRHFSSSLLDVPRPIPQRDLVRKQLSFCTEGLHIMTCASRRCTSELGYICVFCHQASGSPPLCEACGDVMQLSHGVRGQKQRRTIGWQRKPARDVATDCNC